METIKVINKRLATKYGLSLDGRPNYRVVFSDTQFENQFGIFEDFSGDILLRRVKEYRTVRKYEYIDGKHVLEKLWFFDYGSFPDRPFINNSYEPVWTFMDKERNPLYPIWEAVEFAVECSLEGVRRTLRSKVKRDYVAEEKEAKDKDIKGLEDMLGVDGDGVMDMKNQKVNFVKPVFLGGHVFTGGK